MKKNVTFFLIMLFFFSSGTVYGDTVIKPFDEITVGDVMFTLLSSDPIDGSDEDALPGMILLYQTNEGRYGKFEITGYNHTLEFNLVTYNLSNDGTVYHYHNGALVGGTCTFDLDTDETSFSYVETDSDFWWEHLTDTERYLVPLNGAEFTVYPGTPVPIPSAFLLLSSSLIGIAGLRKRFKNSR